MKSKYYFLVAKVCMVIFVVTLVVMSIPMWIDIAAKAANGDLTSICSMAFIAVMLLGCASFWFGMNAYSKETTKKTTEED
jgi:hypothetical protein